jgi:hypothetical protein
MKKPLIFIYSCIYLICFIAGCNANIPVNTVLTPAIVQSPAAETADPIEITAEPTLTQEPTDTPEVTPIPTPEIPLTPEQQLDQNIMDFLNKEGQFTDEKVDTLIIPYANMETRLGLFHTDRHEALGTRNSEVEAILLGYIEKEDSILMVVGLHTRDGSDRFAALAEILTLTHTGKNALRYCVYKLKNNNAAADSTVLKLTNDNGEIKQELDKIIGKAIILAVESGHPSERAIRILNKTWYGKIVLERYPGSCQATFDLLSHAWISPLAETRYGKEIKLNSTKISYKLLTVESLQDVLEKKIDSIPMIDYFQYYLPDA